MRSPDIRLFIDTAAPSEINNTLIYSTDRCACVRERETGETSNIIEKKKLSLKKKTKKTPQTISSSY